VRPRQQAHTGFAGDELGRQLRGIERSWGEYVSHATDYIFALFTQHGTDREEEPTARLGTRRCRSEDALRKS